MNQLKQLIAALAEEFATKLIAGMGQLPMNEITSMQIAKHAAPALTEAVTRAVRKPRAAKAPSDGSRMPRRDPAELKVVIDDIVRILSVSPEGLRSEELQEKTNLSKKEITRPIVLALEGGLIRKTGNKRATTYFVGGGAQTGAKRAAAAKTPKKVAVKKVAKKTAAKKSKTPIVDAYVKKAAAKKSATPTGEKAKRKSKSRTHVEVVPQNAKQDDKAAE
jgi:hypothetical protein